MEQRERIDFLMDLISCNQALYYMCCDENAQLLENGCQTEHAVYLLLKGSGCLDYLYNAGGTAPVLLSHESGILWLAVREMQNGNLYRAHIIGPFSLGEINAAACEKLVETHGGEWKTQLSACLNALPEITVPLYNQYAAMLHFAVNGEHIPLGDIQYQSAAPIDNEKFSHLKSHAVIKDRIKIYSAERALLNAVREGSLENAAERRTAGSVTRVRAYVDDPLQSTRIACTIFTSLCVRAAIEGGLSSTVSYALGDAYIKSIFIAKSISEVGEIKNQMYADFIRRVHSCRTNPKYSKQTQSCCDYIEFHLAEPLNIELLAERLGYTKYYLSRRFKEETGISINNYIKFARIERAKVMLENTPDKIDDIAERLGFGSRSFFDKAFKAAAGCTPADYRSTKQTL